MFVDAGFIVVASFISPFAVDRAMAKAIVGGSRFFEIFVDAPLETCKERDVKGLYAKAQGGGVKNFTGLSSPYEKPLSPDLHLITSAFSVDDSFEVFRDFCQSRLA
jgi:adenylylsulfate kinase-like enzyme